jgi:hypothetical protein
MPRGRPKKDYDLEHKPPKKYHHDKIEVRVRDANKIKKERLFEGYIKLYKLGHDDYDPLDKDFNKYVNKMVAKSEV